MKRTTQEIRFARADRKMNEKIYPSNKEERNLIKLHLQYEQRSKDIDRIWGIMYAKGFKAGRDNSNPLFFDDFDLIEKFQKEISSIQKRIQRIEHKCHILCDDVVRAFYALNAGRGSVSFS